MESTKRINKAVLLSIILQLWYALLK